MELEDEIAQWRSDRDRLLASREDAFKRIDQIILTFSGAAFALSVTALKDFQATGASVWLAVGCWVAFTSAIAICFWSLVHSRAYLGTTISILQAQIRQEESQTAASLYSRYVIEHKRTRLINGAAICFFLLGVVFFGAFLITGALNMPQPQTTTVQGFYPVTDTDKRGLEVIIENPVKTEKATVSAPGTGK